jgi:ribosomal protein S18 acetylase RimI-like enzyme
MGMLIRDLRPDDRDAVREALTTCGAFNEEEVTVAIELFDDGTYPHFGVELEGRIRGYVCMVKTTLTRSTWHLYWICVHPIAQRRGLGRALEAYAVRFARERGGERLVIETSGRPDYEGARAFYRQAGYREAGRIPDYYAAGDDCIYYYRLIA